MQRSALLTLPSSDPAAAMEVPCTPHAGASCQSPAAFLFLDFKTLTNLACAVEACGFTCKLLFWLVVAVVLTQMRLCSGAASVCTREPITCSSSKAAPSDFCTQRVLLGGESAVGSVQLRELTAVARADGWVVHSWTYWSTGRQKGSMGVWVPSACHLPHSRPAGRESFHDNLYKQTTILLLRTVVKGGV